MSNKTLVQSGTAAGPPNEAEYNAVYAAVTATERGRWFLAEYANRNRCADTDLVIAAIARIEAAIHGEAAPQPAAELPRERPAAATTIEPVRANTGERDDDSADVSTQGASPRDGISDAQKDKDYSEAVATIAASLTARLMDSAANVATAPEREAADLQRDIPSVIADAAIREPEDAKVPTPQQRLPQDNAPRWHIEAPDFVFGGEARDENTGSAEIPVEAAPARPEISSAQFLPEITDDQADADEAPPSVAAAEPAPPSPGPTSPAPASPVVAASDAATPAPDFPPPRESVPPPEISRPQLRLASDAVPANQRALRYDSLTVTDALSEDEVIALFG
jgi:hypothetical protein